MATKDTLPRCYDARGLKDCFAKRRHVSGKVICICLSDTRQTPCPFYKSMEQAQKENTFISD